MLYVGGPSQIYATGPLVPSYATVYDIQVHNFLSEILKTEKLRKPKVFSWRSTPT
jgi:hypothetical protein